MQIKILKMLKKGLIFWKQMATIVISTQSVRVLIFKIIIIFMPM